MATIPAPVPIPRPRDEHSSKRINDVPNFAHSAVNTAEKSERAFSSAFDDKEITAGFKNDIVNIAKTARDIERTFEELGLNFKSFDSKKFKQKDGSKVGSLLPTWQSYQKQYRDILETSKENARQLKVVCDDYIKIVLPAVMDPKKDINSLRCLAERHLKRTRPQAENYKKIFKGFETLSQNVGDFASTVTHTLKKVDLKEASDDHIPRINTEIKDVQKSIRQRRANAFDHACNAIGYAAATGAIGAGLVLLFPVVAPSLSLVMGSGAVGGVVAAAGTTTIAAAGTTTVAVASTAAVTASATGTMVAVASTATVTAAGTTMVFASTATVATASTTTVTAASVATVAAAAWACVGGSQVAIYTGIEATSAGIACGTELYRWLGDWVQLTKSQNLLAKNYAFHKIGQIWDEIVFIWVKLVAFAAFCKAVNVDAQSLVDRLNAAMDGEVDIEEIRLRLSEQDVGDIYIALQTALLRYAFEAN